MPCTPHLKPFKFLKAKRGGAVTAVNIQVTARGVRLAGLSEQLHDFFRALFLKRNDFLDKYED